MTQENERDVTPILAIYKEPSGQYVVESNARDSEELDQAYAALACTFARALSRPETRVD